MIRSVTNEVSCIAGREKQCFLFCKENVTLLQGALKKTADQPCYNVIFYLRTTNTQILNKGMPCIYHLLRSIARLLIFRLHFFEHFFITKKNFLTLF